MNENDPEATFSVYTFKIDIQIIRNTSENLSGQIGLFTITGQKIHEEHLSNSQRSVISVNVPTGYYILQIITNQYVYNKKILIIN